MKLIQMYYYTIKYFLKGSSWNHAKGFAKILIYGFYKRKK